MGLGSIVGTGVFVSIGIATAVAGAWVIAAIAVAAAIAACNALSSAQLAASHPVSGGTYEYGYRYLSPALGFTAGWMFLCAKTASAATAALGFSGYLLHLVGSANEWQVPIAVLAVALLTVLVISGLRRSNLMNAGIVAVTIGSLVVFILAGLPDAAREGAGNLAAAGRGEVAGDAAGFLEATALMFVAFAGYARVATMGEEVRTPERTIPRAILLLLIISAILYMAVAAVAVSAAGVAALTGATARSGTPLEAAARALTAPGIDIVVAIGAVTATLGVLLNLILGLSRVVLAMGRRGDLPPLLARLSPDARAPAAAVIAVGIAIGALTATGSIETTWAFSAFSILVYYGLTNLAALRLPKAQRRYPRLIAWAGLAACLFLAFWVPPPIWLAGLGLIGVGLAWHFAVPGLWRRSP